jgi:glycosyltransferase involved in cell wall biosynthesis
MVSTTPLRGRRVLMLLDNPCNPDWRVTKEAEALVAAGASVTILAWDRHGDAQSHEARDGIAIERIHVSRPDSVTGKVLSSGRVWRAFWRRARALRFDVVHAHDFTTLPIGVAIATRRRVPLVYDAHEIYWLMVRASTPRGLQALMRRTEIALLRRVDRLVTVSGHLADYFGRHHRNVTVVGNWYNPIVSDNATGLRLRRELGIDEQAFCIACIGSLGPERMHSLLTAYAQADPDVAVLIAGRGRGEAEIRSAAERLPNLHFVGWRSDPDPLYAAADALFYGLESGDPYSRISSPNTLFLSIARQIPLITTPNGDAGSLIAESRAGEVLDTADVGGMRRAVQRLREPGRREQVLASLASLQDRYSWDRAAERLVSVHTSLR